MANGQDFKHRKGRAIFTDWLAPIIHQHLTLMNSLLINREYQVDGSWYAPRNYLRDNFKSVVKAELIDTTNSCGSWAGYFVQKILNKFYVIIFWQEIVARSDYFMLYTGDSAMEFDALPTEEQCFDCAEVLCA